MKGIFGALSVLGHPLLLVTYLLILILLKNPYIFGYNHISDGGIILIYGFVLSFLIPFIGILLLKGTGLISSLTLEKKMERIGPLIIVTIFYLWFYINCKNNTDIPLVFTQFVLGALLSLLVCFVVNVFLKVSLHTAGLAGLSTYLFILFFSFEDVVFTSDFLFKLILVVVLLLGVIGMGRLYLQAHTSKELLWGVVIGSGAQLIAHSFLF